MLHCVGQDRADGRRRLRHAPDIAGHAGGRGPALGLDPPFDRLQPWQSLFGVDDDPIRAFAADINDDGVVNEADVPLFVNVLLNFVPRLARHRVGEIEPGAASVRAGPIGPMP